MWRPISGLASASALAQALVLVAAPVITRLYSPEDFASYSLLASMAALLAAVMSGRLEMAIPLPKTSTDGVALATAATAMATLIALVAIVLCLAMPATVSDLLGDATLEPIVWLVPLAAYLICGVQILVYLHVRERRYRPLAFNSLLDSMTSTGTQVGTPFTGVPFSGLMLSLVLAPAATGSFLLYSIRRTLQRVPVSAVRAVMSTYREYPLYGTPVAFVNSAVSPVLIWFVFRQYGAEIAGLYAFSQRVLLTPAAVMQEAIRRVFWGEITDVIRTKPAEAVPMFLSLLWKLLAIGTPFVIVTMIYSDPIVLFVFGERWSAAGFIVAVLAPMAAISLATTSLANFSMIGRPKLGLVWSSAQLGMVLLLLSYGGFTGLAFEAFIVAYSVVMTVTYLLQVVLWIGGARRLRLPAHAP